MVTPIAAEESEPSAIVALPPSARETLACGKRAISVPSPLLYSSRTAGSYEKVALTLPLSVFDERTKRSSV
jgi:hypothetical protein